MYNKASDSKKPQPKNVGRRTQRFYLYTSGQDCTIKVWDLMASKLVTTLTNHLSPVTEIDFVDTPQGRRIVSVSRDKMLNVWDATDFKLLFNLPIFEVRWTF
jgi:WD40 repeat protein